MDNNKNSINSREFVNLMTANHMRIYSFILMLVPNRSDAEDIMQEATTLMWERKCDFESGTDFGAWGARIAFFKVRDHRKRINKERRIINDKQFGKFAEVALEKSKHVDTMLSKLEECVKELTEPERMLIQMRYSVGLSAKEISSRINKSIRSVYLAISHIQDILLRCIQRCDA